MSWMKYDIVIQWWDLTMNEFEMEMTYSEYEFLMKFAKLSNKNAIMDDTPYVEVLSRESQGLRLTF